MTVTLEAVRALPKIELHRHLEGTVRPDTVHALAAANGTPLPVDDMRTLYTYRDLRHFLDVYDTVCSTLVSAADFHRIAYESVLDAAATGIVYTEMFFTPHVHLSRGVPAAHVWDGITAGLRDGIADTGIGVRMIMDCTKFLGPALAQIELDLFTSLPDPDGFLVGIGGDGIEAGVDDAALAPVFAEAARRGLRRTYHAGEFSARSVADAVRVLGCERVDHGPLVVEDPALAAEAADRGIVFTLCPSSDVLISQVYPSVRDHSLPRMLEAGLHVTVNSDDPAMLGRDISDEYVTVVEEGLVTPEQLCDIAIGSVDACWLPDDDKAALRARLGAAWGTAF
ncbi:MULTISPECIES: adenosine deaminase [unclassified Rhodococcus (in: high G+C Gram-positive bacteria)]|uniref:adenosine deaminase n=1 Tax=unclassified Rhodococcus (in: high G+C Gram-positive bacteria) TaxID=192944 RepID=UPI00146B9847|nr:MULTISPECIES: adenosine deaminase [unclassified Rhodococcus (in: high G+C Gram-positive bacteria)]MBF0663828.1 adenosine deaminase [Rhodococcus sp. (in: high G+C Gram-positive bacteria)]NME80140.1 adenosine deaminase [Rhodococcus sp. 105337]